MSVYLGTAHYFIVTENAHKTVFKFDCLMIPCFHLRKLINQGASYVPMHSCYQHIQI